MVKNYPFHIKLDARTKTTGVILCDQARTLDINVCNFEFIESVGPENILLEVLEVPSLYPIFYF
jgi:mRNA interferase MazF